MVTPDGITHTLTFAGNVSNFTSATASLFLISAQLLDAGQVLVEASGPAIVVPPQAGPYAFEKTIENPTSTGGVTCTLKLTDGDGYLTETVPLNVILGA